MTTTLAFLISLSVFGNGQNTGANSTTSLFPSFTPSSSSSASSSSYTDVCETNSNYGGDDVYLSIFKPCAFIFYQTKSPDKPIITNCNCSSVDLHNDASIVIMEQRKVLGWPDSSVANGSRCYVLADHPDLQNFTIMGKAFPPDADIVSVDCSADYEETMDVIDNVTVVVPDDDGLEPPVANAIYFFSMVMFIAMVACVGICCVCAFKSTSRSKGYTSVPGVYIGPPVIARKVGDANTAVV